MGITKEAPVDLTNDDCNSMSIHIADRIIAGIYLFASAVLVYMIYHPIDVHLATAFIDDAFYYLGYAKNIALGNGPTFDGIVYTNGIQPLWALLLIGVAYLFPGTDSLIYGMMGLSSLLIVGGGVLLDRAFRSYMPSATRIIVALLYLIFFIDPTVALSGMEIPISAFTISLSLYAVLRISNVNILSISFAGLCVALMVMSRVDLLLLTPAFSLILIWKLNRMHLIFTREFVSEVCYPVMYLALPVVLVFAAYLGFNKLNFDVLLPISGEVKLSYHDKRVNSFNSQQQLDYIKESVQNVEKVFTGPVGFSFGKGVIRSNIGLESQLLRNMGNRIMAISLLTILLGGAYIAIKRKKRRPVVFLVALVSLNVLAHAWVLLYRVPDALGNHWYYTAEIIYMVIMGGLGIWMLGKALNRFIGKCAGTYPSNLFISFLLVLIAINIMTLYSWRDQRHPMVVFYNSALWINKNIPTNEIIGSWDSGVIGYFTKNTVINLDGLMNDKEFMSVLFGAEDGMMEYFKRMNISWLANVYDAEKNYSYFMPDRCLDVRYNEAYQHFGQNANMKVISIRRDQCGW